MGTYHRDARGVVMGQIGRVLEDKGQTYKSYTDQLVAGEQLWLATDKGAWPIVILLDSPHEFEYVMSNREGTGPYVFHAIPIDDN